MKNLKLIFAATTAACLLVAVPAKAQLYGPVNVVNGGTNNVAALATNTYNAQIGLNLTRPSDVALAFSIKAHTSGATSNVTFNFQHSVDGSTWETTPTFSVTIASASTTNIVVTNLTLNSKGFLRLQNIVNTNAAGVISNIIVQAATKQPGWR